ncbi:TPA: hypothetical protein EYO57_09105, partial [Candidatus Poribacteria bacterium]|nr:hypothetical protein [Candidatus Poribacteria bacterium]
MLKWVKRSKFEERRTKFFENCGEGKILSKVSICKQKERPEWTKPLEGQKVKDIRKAIKAFLQALGLLKLDPKSVSKIEKLAKERHWEAVVTLSKDSFEDTHTAQKKGSGRYSRPDRIRRDGRREPNPRFPHISRQSTLSRRDGRLDYEHPRRRRRSEVDLTQTRETRETRVRSPSPPAEWEHSQDESEPEAEEKAERGADYWKRQFYENQGYLKELLKKRPIVWSPPPSPRRGTPPPTPKKTPPPSPPPLPMSGGAPKGDIQIPVQSVPYRSNCVLYDPDEVTCDPDDLGLSLFKKKQQKELLDLAFERKKNCQKLDLMKLRIKEFDLNERMWKSFENNRRGDFMSKFSKKDLNQFQKCGKNAVWSPSQMYQLKAVTNCLNASQELCQNYKDTKARVSRDESVLNSNYMLANYSYRTLELMARNSKDLWVARALKNREPDLPYQTTQLICEEPLKKREIILQKEVSEPPKDRKEEVAAMERQTGAIAGDAKDTQPAGPQSRVAGISTGPIVPTVPTVPIVPPSGPVLPGLSPGLPFQPPYKPPAQPWQPPGPPPGKQIPVWTVPPKPWQQPVQPVEMTCEEVRDYMRMWLTKEQAIPQNILGSILEAEERLLEQAKASTWVDLSILYFLRAFPGKYRAGFVPDKLDYYLHLLFALCTGDYETLNQEIALATDRCKQMEQLLESLQNSWLVTEQMSILEAEAYLLFKIHGNESEQATCANYFNRAYHELGTDP